MMFTIGMDEEMVVAQNELLHNAATLDLGEKLELILMKLDSDIERMFSSGRPIKDDIEKKLQLFDAQVSMIPMRMAPRMYEHWYGKSKTFWQRFFMLRYPAVLFNDNTTLNSSGNSLATSMKSHSVSSATNPLSDFPIPSLSPQAGIIANNCSTAKKIVSVSNKELDSFNSLNGSGWIRAMKTVDEKQIDAPPKASPPVNNYYNMNGEKRHIHDEIEQFYEKEMKISRYNYYEDGRNFMNENNFNFNLSDGRGIKRSFISLDSFEEDTIIYSEAKSYFDDDNFSSISQQFENSQNVISRPSQNHPFKKSAGENWNLHKYGLLMDLDEDTRPTEEMHRENVGQENLLKVRLQRVHDYLNSK